MERTNNPPRVGDGATCRCTVSLDEPGYPRRLKALRRPPPTLHVWGQLPRVEMVAIVGTRGALLDNTRIAHATAAGLIRAGYGVVSGGAIGIDTAAHEGAISAGGKTVAVLGSGLDQLYPVRNRDLFGRIARRGAVVSSFPPGARPLRPHFPQRNALIAVWAVAVVVMEAPVRSGALNTATWARSVGVPVMAMDQGAGARRLLQSGAALVEGVQDILDVLGGQPPRRLSPEPIDLDARAALAAVGPRAVSVDELAARLGWRAPRAAAALIRLELSGAIQLAPGGRWRAPG